jgi:flagellar hook-associated protein 3 FlgL
VVSRAREVAVQMSNGTYSVAQRQSAAKEVENLLEQMVSLANTKYGERYVFAGFRDDAAPFETSEAGGVVTAVTYQGDDGRREVKLGPGSRLETNLTGAEVFQGSGDVFEALINLRDALQANDPAAAAATIDDLRGAGNNLSAMAADMGARLNRCELRLNVIKDTQLADTDSLSKLEDADVVEVIVRLQSKQLIYQAALKAATALQQLNLAAYL